MNFDSTSQKQTFYNMIREIHKYTHCIGLVLIWGNAEETAETAVPEVKPPTIGGSTYDDIITFVK